MLQQIATAKSDVAAYAVEVSDESMSKLQNADEFAFMLANEKAANKGIKKGSDPNAQQGTQGPRTEKAEADKDSKANSRHSTANIAKEQNNDGQRVLSAEDKKISSSHLPNENVAAEAEVQSADVKIMEPLGNEAEFAASNAVTIFSKNTDKMNNDDNLNGSHWLSIVEQLAANSLSETDTATVTKADELLTKESTDKDDLSLSLENEAQELLLSLLKKLNLQSDGSAGEQLDNAGTTSSTPDDVTKMKTLLDNNPELIEQLQQLLTSQDPQVIENKALSSEELENLVEALTSLIDLETVSMDEQASGSTPSSMLDSAESTSLDLQSVQSASQVTEVMQDASNKEIAFMLASVLDGELNQQQLALLEGKPELQKLLQLTPNKLESALTMLAKQVQQINGTANGQVSPEQDMTSSTAPALDNVLSKTEAAGLPEFVLALKAGLAEVKGQLEKGREPGIDLKGLVNDAIKASPELASNMLSSKSEQVELATRSVMQVIDVAQLMSTALEQSTQQQAVNSTYREQGISMVEQTKASQLHQGQFDKALNLAKPEAHQQLAEKVRFMVNTNQLVADIRLDPAELGSMHVKVSVSGESASVSFVVQSLHAKEAIDNATPKLREMLADKGIELGQSSVEQESGEQDGEQQNAGKGQGEANEQGIPDVEVPDGSLQQPIVNGALGGIDYFV
ncbi:flagellar hook-length control protein FliK [Paraglaciecola polaris]|uniref:flagellar hook-length control protein FliK n=1 Tax=Paraglaciecola polaris TaxID=222814 RepID=UPI0030EC212A|tara:strand:+ start:940 stop:2988 length:2049 start_codon:yes stop_codon:yes gene_type:complete